MDLIHNSQASEIFREGDRIVKHFLLDCSKKRHLKFHNKAKNIKNIVPFLEIRENEIVYPFFGNTFEMFMSRSTTEQRTDAFKSICETCYEVFRLGICHGDIFHTNVLFSEEWQPILIDPWCYDLPESMAFVDSPDCYCRNKDSPHERKRHKPCLKLLAYEMGVDLDPYEHICDVLRKKICSCSGSETYNDMKNMTYASFENRDFKMPGWRNTVERLGQFGCEFKGKRILDIGCNCGAISLYLQELGASVTGMEINQERVDMAKEMNRFLGLGAKFRNENIENTMGTHWENYDLVVCLAVTGRTACEGKILRKISEHAKEICFESNNCGNDEYARTLSNLGFKAKKVGETNGFPHRVSYYGTK